MGLLQGFGPPQTEIPSTLRCERKQTDSNICRVGENIVGRARVSYLPLIQQET